MKIFVLSICLFVLQIQINAQEVNPSFIEIKQAIISLNPEVDLINKIIFITTWKTADVESREINKEAYRVYKIYEKAKLKNGEKGIVFISLNLDTDIQNRNLAVRKDGIEPTVVYSDSNLISLLQSGFSLTGTQHTIVFDKTGIVQYTDIAKDQILPSLRNLITR